MAGFAGPAGEVVATLVVTVTPGLGDTGRLVGFIEELTAGSGVIGAADLAFPPGEVLEIVELVTIEAAILGSDAGATGGEAVFFAA